MPLFKYGENSAEGNAAVPLLRLYGDFVTVILGDVEIPSISVQGYFGIDGSISFPKIHIFGKTLDSIEANIRIPLCSINSVILNTSKIDGSFTLITLDVRGSMQIECDIDIPALHVFGTLTQYGVISGDIRLPLLFVRGDTAHVSYITANVTIGRLGAAGIIEQLILNSVSGEIELQNLTVVGILFNSHYQYNETDAVLKYSKSRRFI